MVRPGGKRLATRDYLATTDYEGLPPPRALGARSEATFATNTQGRTDSVQPNYARPTSRIEIPSSADDHYLYADGKPGSKTSLGKVYFTLKDLPSFLLIDIDIYTKEIVSVKDKHGNEVEKKQRTMVASKRLRRQALVEYLDLVIGKAPKLDMQAGYEQLLDPCHIAFDLEARSFQLDEAKGDDVGKIPSDPQRLGRTTRLVVPAKDHAAAERRFSEFRNLVLVETKKQFSRAEKRNRPDDGVGRPIICAVVAKGKFIRAGQKNERDESDKKDLYPRYVQLFFQHECSSKSKYPGSAYGSTAEFIDGSANLAMALNSKSRRLNLMPWSHLVRFKPRVEDNFRLSIECDLVPVIADELSLSSFALYCFPSHLKSPTPVSKRLKELFQGVRVSYRLAGFLRGKYEKTAAEQGWKVDPSDPASEAAELFTRVYTIRDVKANSDVGAVVRKESASQTVRPRFYNVKDYLKILTAPFGASFSHLPLADIGRTKPFWVPLEFLICCGDQVLPNMKHVTGELQALRTELKPLEVAEKASKFVKERLRPSLGGANRYFDWDDEIKSSNIELPFPSRFDAPYEPLKAVPRQLNETRARGVVKSTPSPSLSVLCITSKFKNHGGRQFAVDVKRALGYEFEKGEDQKILDLSADRCTFALVESGPELLRLQDIGMQGSRSIGGTSNEEQKREEAENEAKVERLAKNINMKADVLLAVIDDDKMSRVKYHEIVAEVRRLGDRNMGAVTVCLSKRELDTQQQLHGGQQTLPRTLLHKIKFMLGEKNFETATRDEYVSEKFEDGLIIIGAHISHPESHSTEYCPAVASLVVSRGDDLSFYRSAARTQPSIHRVVETYTEHNKKFPETAQDAAKPEKILKIHAPHISKLKETLTPLLRKWRETHMRHQGLKKLSTKLPRVVFYRDSYHEVDDVTHENEAEQIRRAYKEAFERPTQPDAHVPLTYITATKNPKHHSQPHHGEASRDEVSTPTFTFTTSTFEQSGIQDDHLFERADDAAKYQYQVRFNGAGARTKDHRPTLATLRDLTARLNANAQSLETTSLALPVHYARKLARRVLSYYDYVSLKDVSNLPQLALRTQYGSVTGDEQQRFVNGLLQSALPRGRNRGERLVREGKAECEVSPWSEGLDDKMFFL
ncbi:hypothetical protein PMIN07_009949 [Paraphaeosphaeria minitans]